MFKKKEIADIYVFINEDGEFYRFNRLTQEQEEFLEKAQGTQYNKLGTSIGLVVRHFYLDKWNKGKLFFKFDISRIDLTSIDKGRLGEALLEKYLNIKNLKYKRCPKGSEDQINGVDFFVYRNNKEYKVQVKFWGAGKGKVWWELFETNPHKIV